jgi:hypothetical protein
LLNRCWNPLPALPPSRQASLFVAVFGASNYTFA